MKKTLKFLLAITLFVAIIAIVSAVNADETVVGVNYLEANPTAPATPYLQNGKLTKTVPSTEPKLKIDGNVTIDLDGYDIEPEIVVNGTLTLKSTYNTATITGKIINNGTVIIDENSAKRVTLKEVDNKGTLTLNGGKATTVTLRANGTLNMKSTSEVATLNSEKSYEFRNGTIGTFQANNKDVVLTMDKNITRPTPLSNLEGTFATFGTLGNGDAYYADKSKVEVTFDIRKVPTGESTRDLKAGESYVIDAKAKMNGKELGVVPKFTPQDTRLGNVVNTEVTLNSGEKFDYSIRMNKDLGTDEMVFSVAYDTISLDDKSINGKETPATTAPATTAPATTAPATTAPADNKGEKDDTPKTGDHIIPATALLAVVVVANVVYFAKSKRS